MRSSGSAPGHAAPPARVAGSLWSVPRAQLAGEAQRLADGGLELWHWDRSDGSMARAGGFGAAEARALASDTGLRSEAHLMLAAPLGPELSEWLAFCERVVVHVEAADWRAAVDRIRAAGVDAAVAISPTTPLPASGVLPDGVAVLTMSVVPGEAGSGFDGSALDRVTHWASGGEPGQAPREVGVDGGVGLAEARAVRAAGGSWFVSGSALTAAPETREFLRDLAG